jgi:hypothetical protein
MIFNKLKTLEDILRSRLPNVMMWGEVGIFFPGDNFPPGTILQDQIQPGHFIILWHHKRRADNPHPCRWKEIPLTIDDLNAVIKRQREKLRTESETA